MRAIVAICLTFQIGVPDAAAEQGCMELRGYERGLCLYTAGEYGEAVDVLGEVAGRDDSVGIRAQYFLARSLMKLERWEEASSALIEIFRRSPAFYRLWNCDYLLGVSREKGAG